MSAILWRNLRRRAIVLIVLAWCWAWSGAAQAQSCDLTGSSTTIDFGTINPLLPADTLNSGGLIKLNCSGLSLFTRVCISLGTARRSRRARWATVPTA